MSWSDRLQEINFQQSAQVAEALVRPYVRETPLEIEPYLSKAHNCSVSLKGEHLQVTGSFKVRGAIHRLLQLFEEERQRGVIAASTGNHGAAVAYGLDTLGIAGEIVVPKNAKSYKIGIIQSFGGNVVVHGDDGVEAERFARARAIESGKIYLSPYNDLNVVLGQATIGVELARQLDVIDEVYVALGGGGLISGVGGYLKSINPKVKVIGCSPENSKVMIESLKAGRILDLPSEPTLSDGTAGGVEQDAITFSLCQQIVDDYVTVTEDEIKHALTGFVSSQRQIIEGAAAVPLAALHKRKELIEGKNVVVVLCGRNIHVKELQKACRIKVPWISGAS